MSRQVAQSRKEWTRVRFGDIAEQINERVDDPNAAGVERYVGLEHLDSDSLRVTRWGSPDEVSAQKLRFHPGDIIFGKRRAYQRKVAVADFEGICSAHAMVLREREESVAPGFLIHFMASDVFMERAVQVSVGSLSPTINWSTLRDQEFDLPPIGEQHRIAGFLAASSRLRAVQREVVSTAWSMRMAGYKTLTLLGWKPSSTSLPTGWHWGTIGEVMQIENQLRKPINATVRASMQGPYPYHGPTGAFDSINEYRLDGTYALIGEDGDHFLKHTTSSMTQLVTGRFNVNNHAHVLRGSPDCSTEWFFHFYRHRDVREWLAKQGSGRLKLKKATLERMPIALPPRRKQDELVSMLSRLEEGCDITNRRSASTLRLENACRDYMLDPA